MNKKSISNWKLCFRSLHVFMQILSKNIGEIIISTPWNSTDTNLSAPSYYLVYSEECKTNLKV